MSTEKKAVHTPGPWEVSHLSAAGKRTAGLLIREAGHCITLASVRRENEANARLIAAAPDLLEALKELQHAVAECDLIATTKALFKAEAVIRKAEGS